MKQTIGGIAAVVASLWAGCSTTGPEKLGFQEITVKSYNPNDPKHYFNSLVERMMGENYLGVGCPLYGSMLEPKRYEYTLTHEDIDATSRGDTTQVLHLSTNRILNERRSWGEKTTDETRRNVEFFLPIQNPRFYDHHQFEARETIRYVVFESDSVGGTLNCTL